MKAGYESNQEQIFWSDAVKKQDLLKSKRKQSPEYGPHKLSKPNIFNDASNIKHFITKWSVMKKKRLKTVRKK